MTRSSARLLLNLGLAAVAGLPALSAASAQAEILLNNGPAAGRVKVVGIFSVVRGLMPRIEARPAGVSRSNARRASGMECYREGAVDQ